MIRKASISPNIASIDYKLMKLFIGRKGGDTSIKIMECISVKPSNINQIAEELGITYNTVKYHVDLLSENGLLENNGSKYGRLYYFSEKLLNNFDKYQEILRTLNLE